MENKSIHSEIEVLVTDVVPEKATGIELQPREKMKFSIEEGKNLYARCSDMNHVGVNLAVANFDMPVSGNSGMGILIPKMDKIETIGIYEWIVPKDGWYKVIVTGGGGSGGNAYLLPETTEGKNRFLCGGAGGGGGTAIKDIYLTKNKIIPIVVGSGGIHADVDLSGKAYYGSAGNTSSFGNFISATGGKAGEGLSGTLTWGAANHCGGYGVGGTFNFCGFDGNGHSVGAGNLSTTTRTSAFYTSAGGASYWGGTGLHRRYYSGNGDNGTAWGTGGSGGRAAGIVNTAYYGGKGADGVVVIEWTEVH